MLIRDDTLLIIKYKVMASDNNTLAIYISCNTVSYDIVNFGMHFFMDKFSVYCFFYNCICHRMWEMLFQACCDLQDLILGHIIKHNYICQYRLCLCKSTGLVKYDGVRLRYSL